MDVDLIFEIAAVGILVSVLNQVLSRSRRDEQVTMTTLAGPVVVLMMVVQQISSLFELVKSLFGLRTTEDILEVVVAAVVATVCAVVVKQRTQEVGLALSLAAGALVPIMALEVVESVRVLMDELGKAAGPSPAMLAPVFKTAGITILTHISAEMCRDAKKSGIAAFVETVGAAMTLCVALPLLRAVLDTVTGLL